MDAEVFRNFLRLFGFGSDIDNYTKEAIHKRRPDWANAVVNYEKTDCGGLTEIRYQLEYYPTTGSWCFMGAVPIDPPKTDYYTIYFDKSTGQFYSNNKQEALSKLAETVEARRQEEARRRVEEAIRKAKELSIEGDKFLANGQFFEAEESYRSSYNLDESCTTYRSELMRKICGGLNSREDGKAYLEQAFKTNLDEDYNIAVEKYKNFKSEIESSIPALAEIQDSNNSFESAIQSLKDSINEITPIIHSIESIQSQLQFQSSNLLLDTDSSSKLAELRLQEENTTSNSKTQTFRQRIVEKLFD